MLAGYDRIIHDKALQQELLDAGLLVKVDPATGELIEGSDPASPEAPDDIEKAYWVGRDVGRMEMRQDIARAQLNCQHQVLGCINCGKPFGHGDTPSAALAASESSHG